MTAASIAIQTQRPAGPAAREEIDLVRRLQIRDPAAFEELYERFGPAVYRLAWRYVRDTAAAEDLAQEAFLAVWLRIGRFDSASGSLAAWIHVVVRNRAIDYLRSAQWRLSRDSTPLDPGERDAQTDPAVPSSDWDLRGPWMKLTDQQRKTLWLAHWAGCSQSEIAARLDRPLGTIKSWTRSAHRILRAALEAPAGGSYGTDTL